MKGGGNNVNDSRVCSVRSSFRMVFPFGVHRDFRPLHCSDASPFQVDAHYHHRVHSLPAQSKRKRQPRIGEIMDLQRRIRGISENRIIQNIPSSNEAKGIPADHPALGSLSESLFILRFFQRASIEFCVTKGKSTQHDEFISNQCKIVFFHTILLNIIL